jgi:DNA-binding CsgD family transcriptional regulator
LPLARFSASAPNGPVLFLLVPIALVGWRWGSRPAWACSVVALAAIAGRAFIVRDRIGGVAYLSGTVAFLTVAALASSLHQQSDRGAGPISSAAPVEDLLTEREIEILARMAEGMTNAQIADRLVISEHTVKSHVKSILGKLGARNRAEAVCRYCMGGRGSALL